MARTADILIIGAGITGMSLAFHLAHRRVGRILVIERECLSAGATGRSGALVRCQYGDSAETRLAITSLGYFEKWGEIVGGHCGFTAVGLITLAPRSAIAQVRKDVVWQKQLGVGIEEISHDELRQHDHLLKATDDVGIITFERAAGFADPVMANYSLFVAARKMGVDFAFGSPAREMELIGSRCSSVLTDSERISTGAVVIAAGAWSMDLLGQLAVDFGLVPTLSRVSVFRDPSRGEAGLRPTCVDHLQGAWFRPMLGDGLLVGAEFGCQPNTDPNDIPLSIPDTLLRKHLQILHARYNLPKYVIPRGSWACAFMNSADSKPVLGRLQSYENVYVIAGDSGTSFKTAPAIGLGLSELLVDGEARSVDLKPFSPARFTSAEPAPRNRHYTDYATIAR